MKNDNISILYKSKFNVPILHIHIAVDHVFEYMFFLLNTHLDTMINYKMYNIFY